MNELRFFGEGLPYLGPVDCTGALITLEGTDGAGRTTQLSMLRRWLEEHGHGVIETGWTRSPLIGRVIAQAKQFRTLNRFTYSLLYASDFADRLEKEIIPALRSGFIVLSDRYVFTAFARDVIRGVDRQWVRDLFGFAPIPHLVLYLKIDVATLIRRVIPRGVIDSFESGMDMALGDDPYDSFKRYQTLLLREYNAMADEFGFSVVNARMKPERIQEVIRRVVSEFFAQRQSVDTPPAGEAAPLDAGAVVPARPDTAADPVRASA